jgi:hypothetical protein
MTLLAVLALACRDPGGPDPGAIEITGYLDGARVAVVGSGAEATAIGRDGAASAGSAVALDNVTTGASAEGIVGELGQFALSVHAGDGDRVEVKVDDASPDDVVVVDLAPADPFPPTTHQLAYVDPVDPHRALIEVLFDPGRLDGAVWAADAAIGASTVLAPFAGGATHGGVLDGAQAGDEVVIAWVAGGVASEGVVLTVAP